MTRVKNKYYLTREQVEAKILKAFENFEVVKEWTVEGRKYVNYECKPSDFPEDFDRFDDEFADHRQVSCSLNFSDEIVEITNHENYPRYFDV